MKRKNTKNELKWYVINSSSGQEKKVAELIKIRVKANNLEDKITEVVVPTQEKVTIKKGKKQNIEERILPGYILVKMMVDDHTMHIIKNTDGVIGFVGAGKSKNPTPLNDEQANSILAYMEIAQPTSFHAGFQINDTVKITQGPFTDHVGTVSSINENKGKVTVLISFMGREVPVELDFLQVTKI